MARTLTLALLSCMLCIIAGHARAAMPQGYLDDAALPDARVYLPEPPDTSHLAFAADFMRWQWGKTMRANSTRGSKAKLDCRLNIERTSEIYSSALKFTIDSVNTPCLYRLLKLGGETAVASTIAARDSMMRKRPFVQMNEHSWGESENEPDLRATGSFPSAHAAWGWATALLLAEISGTEQNDVYLSGYDYGTSRVITGACWQSDVEAGRLCAAAAVACLHNSAACTADIAQARAEYYTLRPNASSNKGATAMPDGKVFIPAPPDTLSADFTCDIVNYWQAKSLRYTDRSTTAITDADSTTMAYINTFAEVMGVEPDSVPSLAVLITQATQSLRTTARDLKSVRSRRRPYVQLNEPTLIADDEAAYRPTSSHPSEAAQIGWGLALLMAEVAPERQDQILKRGYDYGDSRLIAGYQYATDVASARTLAAAVVARLHSTTTFTQLLATAKDEVALHRAP